MVAPTALPTHFSLNQLTDVAALGPRWRALEARANGSFFQSWTWLGCLARERFPNPVLFAAQRDGQDIALALFNQKHGKLYLAESGDATWDALYIEHNGLLCATGEELLIPPALAWLAARRALNLSGINTGTLDALRQSGVLHRIRYTARAPYVDLPSLPPGVDGVIAHCSANTRQQLRRSTRRYAAQFGALNITRASDVSSALEQFSGLSVLHQAHWNSRSKPGAFAHPIFQRFHQALIRDAFDRSEVDLLQITAGNYLLGFLYNFRYRGHVLSYQSGFDYRYANAQQKPGLTAHHLAISLYRAEHMRRYDLLAGDTQYKLSLANGSTALHWCELAPKWSAIGIMIRLRAQ